MSYMESYGFVYVVTDGTAFKVGETSGCPTSRLKNLQCGNPKRIRLVRAYESADRKAVEKHLHEHLQPWRCSGGSEWFGCTIADIDEAAEDLESLFGAVDVGPCQLLKLPKEPITRKIDDYWIMGGTLTLCLRVSEPSEPDCSGCLNFTWQSDNKLSQDAGKALILKLGSLLGIRRPSLDSIRRKLIMTFPYRYEAPELYITYRRKRSRWIDLNDFELLSLSCKPARHLEAAQ